MEGHSIWDHTGAVLTALSSFMVVFLPAVLDGLITLKETGSKLDASIAFIRALTSSSRWIKLSSEKRLQYGSAKVQFEERPRDGQEQP